MTSASNASWSPRCAASTRSRCIPTAPRACLTGGQAHNSKTGALDLTVQESAAAGGGPSLPIIHDGAQSHVEDGSCQVGKPSMDARLGTSARNGWRTDFRSSSGLHAGAIGDHRLGEEPGTGGHHEAGEAQMKPGVGHECGWIHAGDRTEERHARWARLTVRSRAM